MSLHAIEINENSLDAIAAVNGGLRPKIEETPTIFIWNDDPDGHNDIVPVNEFLKTYWYDWNIMTFCWTDVKKL